MEYSIDVHYPAYFIELTRPLCGMFSAGRRLWATMGAC
jgi:hypothetical protein